MPMPPRARIRSQARAVLPAGTLLLIALAAGALAGCDAAAAPAQPPANAERRLPLGSLRLPPGFDLRLFAPDVPGARSLALSPSGVLYVGTRKEGKVYAVLDRDRDGRAERVLTIARGLEQPNGVAFRDGALYVAEVSRILRFDGIERRLEKPPRPVVVTAAFPRDEHHGWKFIRFGPDGLLYVPVGAPCNVCDRDEPLYASLTRLRPDGTGLAVYAHGIRNTVGFDWQPGTGVLWFTENGRDLMGDDVPPDELNRAPRAGLHFGFPHCHGAAIPDPQHGPRGGAAGCRQYTPPALALGPHVAALGMRFYTGRMFPAAYRGQIFYAEHGSWNRSRPIGYRVMTVRFEGGRAVAATPFVAGWLGRSGKAWGRPVDVEVAADGALLISDDEAGAIYRVTHRR
jgi:glucose/arabinose dehydrogenase